MKIELVPKFPLGSYPRYRDDDPFEPGGKPIPLRLSEEEWKDILRAVEIDRERRGVDERGYATESWERDWPNGIEHLFNPELAELSADDSLGLYRAVLSGVYHFQERKVLMHSVSRYFHHSGGFEIRRIS